MVSILERLTQAQERQEIQLQRQAQDNTAAFLQIQARQDEFQRQQLEIQRQQAATQQQYLELLRHLVTVGVPPPPSVLTLALQPSGLQSQGPQPSFQFASPQQQVHQSFQSLGYTPIHTGFTPSVQLRPHLLTGTPFSTDLSASYSELTGQPTPSQTTVLTTTEILASKTVAPFVTGTRTMEVVPSSVASTDPPTIGTL
jgi:hypothetical protein